MAYVPTYDQGDIAPVAIDGIVSVLALVVSFASLIGLIWLYGYFKKNLR